MKKWSCHPCVLSLDITFHYPQMFIWMTFAQLQHLDGLLSSSQRYGEGGGGGCQGTGCANHTSPTFYRLSYKLVMYLVCLSEQTLVLKQCADTHSKGAPSCPVFIPNIQHPLSLPLRWFTSLFTASVTFYGDDVHTFLLFARISPCLNFTEAQKDTTYLKNST